MKNIFLGTAVAVILFSSCLIGSSCGTRNKSAKAPHDTLVVNTTEIGKDIKGFKGPTPLEITLVDGIVTEIKALPNEETRVSSNAL